MRPFLLVLLLLALGACAAAPEGPPPAAAPQPPSPPAAASPRVQASLAEVTLEEGSLWILLREDGLLRCRLKPEAEEEWQLPAAAAARVVGEVRSSGFFGPSSRPVEAGGALRLSFKQGDLVQVRAPREASPELQALARRLKDLVPGSKGVGPDQVWIAGTLVYEDLEGGLWKIQVDPERSFVLATPPSGLRPGERVRATGRPAPQDSVGIHMAGPTYEVLTLRAAGSTADPGR